MPLDEDDIPAGSQCRVCKLYMKEHTGISPENQMSEIALMDYVRTLPQITCDKLTKADNLVRRARSTT